MQMCLAGVLQGGAFIGVLFGGEGGGASMCPHPSVPQCCQAHTELLNQRMLLARSVEHVAACLPPAAWGGPLLASSSLLGSTQA